VRFSVTRRTIDARRYARLEALSVPMTSASPLYERLHRGVGGAGPSRWGELGDIELAASGRLALRLGGRRHRRRDLEPGGCGRGGERLLHLVERRAGLLEVELELRGLDALGLRREDAPALQLELLLQDRVRLAQLLELPERERLLLLEPEALVALAVGAVGLGAEQRLELAVLLPRAAAHCFERPGLRHQLVVREHDESMHDGRRPRRVRPHRSPVKHGRFASVLRRQIEVEAAEESSSSRSDSTTVVCVPSNDTGSLNVPASSRL
jgi:hypothetical protein